MATVLRSLYFLIILYVSNIPLAFSQEENQFVYHGFSQANLHLGGIAEIHRNGLLQLTNLSFQRAGSAFHRFPLNFNTTSSGAISSLSFSTTFVFAMVPQEPNMGGHGMAFAISPSMDFTHAVAISIWDSSTRQITALQQITFWPSSLILLRTLNSKILMKPCGS
ncbi:putative L-type lectin-domain containing receptor kinase I.6 [Morella rubra]|uniref:Putative L-type lectin-domain containing receptor kinase I.6 n=1 Tax=Morella rubra TaxID=262757 RepID=A0A6A1WKS7_9ROSI|nr:putative L-type lectin-domain containing receptor kinase I.6 [Morella rubra]